MALVTPSAVISMQVLSATVISTVWLASPFQPAPFLKMILSSAQFCVYTYHSPSCAGTTSVPSPPVGHTHAVIWFVQVAGTLAFTVMSFVSPCEGTLLGSYTAAHASTTSLGVYARSATSPPSAVFSTYAQPGPEQYLYFIVVVASAIVSV